MTGPDQAVDDLAAAIDAEVATAFARPVSAYTVTPIDPEQRHHSVTGGVFRVRADDDAALVLKIIRRGVDADPGGMWLSGATVEHRNYWKREWLAYSQGVLAELPGELRAPRLAHASSHGPGEAWLWLEDVDGRPGASWPPADYASAAFDLGTTQGGYAAGAAPLPDLPWLSHQWLRGWVTACEGRLDALADDVAWADPQRAGAAALRDRVTQVWAARSELLAIVEAAPATLVHLDLWPTNLIAADDGTTVAIDWSQVGIGGLGQDLDQLVLDPVWMQLADPDVLAALHDAVLPAYLAGLMTAGVEVTQAELVLWHAAAAGIRYAPLLPTLAGDPDTVATLERRWGSVGPVLASRTVVLERAVELAEWALERQ